MSARVGIVGMEDGPEAVAGPSIVGALSQSPWTVCAIGLSAFECGIWREPRAADSFCFSAPPSPLDFVAELQRRRIHAVLPGSSSAALLIADAAPALARASIATPFINAEAWIRRSRDGLHQLGAESLPSVAARGWDLPESIGETSIGLGLTWPLLLTTDIGLRMRVATQFHAVRAARRLRDAGATRITAMEAAPWCQYEVVVIIGRNGTVIASAAVRVLADDERERPWMAVSIDNPDLLRTARQCAESLSIGGALTLRYSENYGFLALKEVVCGLPHWVELSTAAGACLAAAQVHDLLPAPQHSAQTTACVPAGLVFSACAEDQTITPKDLLARIVEPRS